VSNNVGMLTMHRILVAGIGTNVGKTVVSAILTHIVDGDYWKPIECESKERSDTTTIKKWIDPLKTLIHPPAYSLQNPLSPHHAARLENVYINSKTILPPKTDRSLIIEGVGGIYVPLTMQELSFHLFKTWGCKWIVVSNHYLGSINHTLLTIEVLKQFKIPILGVIFNGEPNLDSEMAILSYTKLPFLGRLIPEPHLNKKIITKYASLWQTSFLKILR